MNKSDSDALPASQIGGKKFGKTFDTLEAERIDALERLNKQLDTIMDPREEREIIKMRDKLRYDLARMYLEEEAEVS